MPNVSPAAPRVARAHAPAPRRRACALPATRAADVETQGNRFRVLCEEIANDYARADLLLRLPGFTPMPAFRRVEDVPLVVRMSRTPRDEIRRHYGIAADAKVVIYNFGGQPSGWTLRESFLPPGWVCLVCTALAVPELPPNFIKPCAAPATIRPLALLSDGRRVCCARVREYTRVPRPHSHPARVCVEQAGGGVHARPDRRGGRDARQGGLRHGVRGGGAQ